MCYRWPHMMLRAIFALALVFSSVLGAVAEGAMATGQRGALTMVICATGGPVTVQLDSSGQPVEPSGEPDCSLCPVCTLHVDALAGVVTPWVRPPETVHYLKPRYHTAQRAAVTARWRLARGPPEKEA